MSTIDMNSIVKINGGKSMTMVEFADKYGLDILNQPLLISSANLLEKRGQLVVVDKTTKEEKILNKAYEEEVFHQVVEGLDNQEEANKQRKRQAILSETDSHSFALAFNTTLDATKFEMWVNSLGVQETGQFNDETGAIQLAIKNTTPQEYTKITNRYKAENAINAGMNLTNKAVSGTTNAVNYGLTNVVAPTAKIAGEAGMNLAKGIFHTGVKTLAGLVNSGAKAVVDTKIALSTDADCLRATNTLMNTRDDFKRQVAKRMNQSSMSNGITSL